VADIPLNITGNLVEQALASAKAIDTLITATKKEEQALAGLQVGLARAQAAKDPIGADKIKEKVKASADRISGLKTAIAQARSDGQQPTKLGIIAAVEKSGGPIGGFVKNIKAAYAAVKENPWAAAALGATALAVGLAKAGSALLGLARDAATAGLSLADEARKAALLNEAVDIAVGKHHQLSEIIEDARNKSTVGRATLAGYAREIRLLGFDSRQTQLVLRSMAFAETALGSGAAQGVRAIAEQSRQFRRFTLGIRDAYGEYASLRKIGLTKADLFAELARSSGKSIDQVRTQISTGRFSVKAGMAAIEAALSRKFGGVIRAQAKGIGAQLAAMKDDFEGLFSGQTIEPFLKGLSSITGIFSQNTASGQSFKKILGGLFEELGKTAEVLGPEIRDAILGMAAEAAKPGGLATTIRGWIADAKGLAGTVSKVADAIIAIGNAANAAAHPVDTFFNAFKYEGDKGKKLVAIEPLVSEGGATKSGEQVALGAAAGVKSGAGAFVDAVRGMVKEGKGAFDSEAKIKSPSKLFEERAAYIPPGAARGVQKATPAATAAIAKMTDTMGQAFAFTGSGGGGGGISIGTIEFNATFSGADASLEPKVKRWVREEIVSAVARAADQGWQPRRG